MGRIERVQPLPGKTIRCFAVLGTRSAVFESPSPSGARRAGGGSGAIGTNRRGEAGGRGIAQQLSWSDGRTASAEFSLENPSRHRALPGRASESRRTIDEIDLGRARPEAFREFLETAGVEQTARLT